MSTDSGNQQRLGCRLATCFAESYQTATVTLIATTAPCYQSNACSICHMVWLFVMSAVLHGLSDTCRWDLLKRAPKELTDHIIARAQNSIIDDENIREQYRECKAWQR